VRKIIVLILICLTLPVLNYSQPKAEEILQRVQDNFKSIKDYTAEGIASVEMERLRIPRRKFTVQFKQPDKFHYDSEGFAMLPREGFSPMQFQNEKYNATFVLSDSVNNLPTYKLELTLKEGRGKGKQFYVWVDNINWVVRKFESKPFEGRLTLATFEYGKVENKYLLPSNIRVELISLKEEENSMPDIKGMENMPRRLPRAGIITIIFTKYVVNNNLPDTIFEENK
jgi:outer membrane lipoprotein-sorting protein